MLFICHRVNKVEDLRKIPFEYGVEVDVRDRDQNLILSHDPLSDGELFEEYLKDFNHALLVINIKSQHLEVKILEILNFYNIKNYFFLDSAFSSLVMLNSEDNNNISFAGRLSEYESIETIELSSKLINWVWVDSFTRLGYGSDEYKRIRSLNKRICLTGPDLLGRPDDIKKFKEEITKLEILPDAICTKFYNIDLWS